MYNVLESVLKSVLDNVLESVLDSVPESILDSVLDRVLDRVLERVLDRILDRVLNNVVNSALGGILSIVLQEYMIYRHQTYVNHHLSGVSNARHIYHADLAFYGMVWVYTCAHIHVIRDCGCTRYCESQHYICLVISKIQDHWPYADRHYSNRSAGMRSTTK